MLYWRLVGWEQGETQPECPGLPGQGLTAWKEDHTLSRGQEGRTQFWEQLAVSVATLLPHWAPNTDAHQRISSREGEFPGLP